MLHHAVLHLNGTANSVDNAAKLDESAVACALDHASVVHRDGGIDQVAAQRSQSRQNAILVGTGEPTVSDDIRSKDCRKLSGFGLLVPLRSKLSNKGEPMTGIFPTSSP
jgi:hypothetical protein